METTADKKYLTSFNILWLLICFYICIFLQFEFICIRFLNLFLFILVGVLWDYSICGINLGEILSYIASDIFFRFCSLFLYSHYTYVTTFVVIPHFLDIMLHFFQSLFSLLFSFEVSTDTSSSAEIFLLLVSSLLLMPIKDILYYCYSSFDL